MKTATAYAPGRVELLGNHTDYNQGLVLAAAIDRGLTAHGTLRTDGRVVLSSQILGRRHELLLADIAPSTEAPWVNYPLGVVNELIAAGHRLQGFELELSGDLPMGGGLSSSAAVEVATALLLMKLHDLHIPPLALAKLCHRAENVFVGVPSGLLDQATCVFGRADHAVFLDCQNEAIQTVPLPPEFALIIASSGAAHALVAGEYSTRREQCLAAAQALGVSSLREVSSAGLENASVSLDLLLRRRAAHVTGENERVATAVQALRRSDGAALGALMNASHESSRVNFENSTPLLDRLTELARALPGVLGARLTGGGFGGSAIVLVQAELATAAAEQLAVSFRCETGLDATPFITRASDGAR
ncbi:MAG: galK [Verrucomicrobiaceae bacterium]|nr:galK [Verrucomicrobiaceae bacterium]